VICRQTGRQTGRENVLSLLRAAIFHFPVANKFFVQLDYITILLLPHMPPCNGHRLSLKWLSDVSFIWLYGSCQTSSLTCIIDPRRRSLFQQRRQQQQLPPPNPPTPTSVPAPSRCRPTSAGRLVNSVKAVTSRCYYSHARALSLHARILPASRQHARTQVGYDETDCRCNHTRHWALINELR